ncbi:pseudaminic acid synthase [Paracoccus sp. SSJ]|uniref:pseudaminic acid synthase n=1 Tax=Paracoccus sp. SSJ TaxID=3050636 RepID=UPI0025510C6F|nr:pseudaminic acid synthase [Paracoccus sp. SSJ]MDK8874848.1 pseudaminic acid synthase [Paracoccus sp. SSJ]
MTRPFNIAGHPIGLGHQPFIIAEMSGNHNQSLDRALAIVEAAAKTGVHALKLQTYTADTMTIDVTEGEFHISDETSLWAGKSLHKLYQEAYTPWEWHKPIFDRCRELGMVGFSSAFDPTSVDFLETLDVPVYKIASFEMTDLELVAKVARTGKPVIISTGMANVAEIAETVDCARDNGCKDLVLLKCTSAYPATAADANLASIPALRQMFGCEVGLSDHTMGTAVSVAAVPLGAVVFEKHFTLARADGGVDSAFSLEPDELARLVSETRDAQLAIGKPTFGGGSSEKTSRSHRRSLYVVKDLKTGDMLDEDNLRSIRPGLGLPVKYRKVLLGTRVKKDVKRGTPMDWDLL